MGTGMGRLNHWEREGTVAGVVGKSLLPLSMVLIDHNTGRLLRPLFCADPLQTRAVA